MPALNVSREETGHWMLPMLEELLLRAKGVMIVTDIVVLLPSPLSLAR